MQSRVVQQIFWISILLISKIPNVYGLFQLCMLIYNSFNITISVFDDCCIQKVKLFCYLMRKVYRRCCIIEMVYEFFNIHINRLLHRKCAVRIFIHKSQNFRNEWVSVANEWIKSTQSTFYGEICLLYIQGQFHVINLPNRILITLYYTRWNVKNIEFYMEGLLHEIGLITWNWPYIYIINIYIF